MRGTLALKRMSFRATLEFVRNKAEIFWGGGAFFLSLERHGGFPMALEVLGSEMNYMLHK